MRSFLYFLTALFTVNSFAELPMELVALDGSVYELDTEQSSSKCIREKPSWVDNIKTYAAFMVTEDGLNAVFMNIGRTGNESHDLDTESVSFQKINEGSFRSNWHGWDNYWEWRYEKEMSQWDGKTLRHRLRGISGWFILGGIVKDKFLIEFVDKNRIRVTANGSILGSKSLKYKKDYCYFILNPKLCYDTQSMENL